MKKKHIKARLLFAANLRQMRELTKISQEQLGELANLHRTYVSSVERGKRNVTIDSMEKLAEALKIDIREFLKPHNETAS